MSTIAELMEELVEDEFAIPDEYKDKAEIRVVNLTPPTCDAVFSVYEGNTAAAVKAFAERHV